MSKGKILSITLGVVFVVGLGVLFWRGSFWRGARQFKVGDYVLTQKDLEYSNKVAAVDSPDKSPMNGRDRLVRGYSSAQILKDLKMEVTPQMTKAEEDRLTRLAQPGTFIGKIKAIFGEDTEHFRRVYVFPGVAEKRLYQEYYLKKNPSLVEARKRAERFLTDFRKAPKGLEKLAKAHGLKVETLIVSRAAGLEWEKPIGQEESIKSANAPLTGKSFTPNPKPTFAGDFWYQRFAGLKEGQIYTSLVEHTDSWLVVRLLRREPKLAGSMRMEAVKLPKTNYPDWHFRQSSTIKVEYP